jgi:hypothetical protein
LDVTLEGCKITTANKFCQAFTYKQRKKWVTVYRPLVLSYTLLQVMQIAIMSGKNKKHILK